MPSRLTEGHLLFCCDILMFSQRLMAKFFRLSVKGQQCITWFGQKALYVD